MTTAKKLLTPTEAFKEQLPKQPRKVGRPKKFENMNAKERHEDLARRFHETLDAIDENARLEKERYQALTTAQKGVIRDLKGTLLPILEDYRDLRHPRFEDVVDLNRIDEGLRMHFREDDE